MTQTLTVKEHLKHTLIRFDIEDYLGLRELDMVSHIMLSHTCFTDTKSVLITTGLQCYTKVCNTKYMSVTLQTCL